MKCNPNTGAQELFNHFHKPSENTHFSPMQPTIHASTMLCMRKLRNIGSVDSWFTFYTFGHTFGCTEPTLGWTKHQPSTLRLEELKLKILSVTLWSDQALTEVFLSSSIRKWKCLSVNLSEYQNSFDPTEAHARSDRAYYETWSQPQLLGIFTSNFPGFHHPTPVFHPLSHSTQIYIHTYNL